MIGKEKVIEKRKCFIIFVCMKLQVSVWLCFRMPAILDGEEEVRNWLNFGEVKSRGALKLLQSKDMLTFHPVSSLVNNSRNNSPECLQPVDLDSKKVSDLLWYFTDCGCKL